MHIRSRHSVVFYPLGFVKSDKCIVFEMQRTNLRTFTWVPIQSTSSVNPNNFHIIILRKSVISINNL